MQLTVRHWLEGDPAIITCNNSGKAGSLNKKPILVTVIFTVGKRLHDSLQQQYFVSLRCTLTYLL